MRKSGLHKQISSIFDGVPVPQDDGQMSPPVEEQRTVQEDAAETVQEDTAKTVQQHLIPVSNETPMGKSSGSSLLHRMSNGTPQFESAPEETAPMSRPMPLSRNQAALKQKNAASISEQVKRVVVARKAKMDPRQRKMTVLVGILSVAFAAVLYISLGGLSGHSGPETASAATESSDVQSKTSVKSVDEWKVPQTIPETLRDPMKRAVKEGQGRVGQKGEDSLKTGHVNVRGIVFSKTRPTAIINDTIMTQGESLNGVTIIKIEKDSVEFEMDGNRWTQKVQR